MTSRPKKLDGMADVFVEFEEVKAQLEKLTNRKGELEAEIRGAMGRAEEGTINGVTVVTYKEGTTSSFDQSSFKEKHPIIAKRFMVFSTRRTLLVKVRKLSEALRRG